MALIVEREGWPAGFCPWVCLERQRVLLWLNGSLRAALIGIARGLRLCRARNRCAVAEGAAAAVAWAAWNPAGSGRSSDHAAGCQSRFSIR